MKTESSEMEKMRDDFSALKKNLASPHDSDTQQRLMELISKRKKMSWCVLMLNLTVPVVSAGGLIFAAAIDILPRWVAVLGVVMFGVEALCVFTERSVAADGEIVKTIRNNRCLKTKALVMMLLWIAYSVVLIVVLYSHNIDKIHTNGYDVICDNTTFYALGILALTLLVTVVLPKRIGKIRRRIKMQIDGLRLEL